MHTASSVNDLTLIHFTVEAGLAAVVWLLYRRLEAVRSELPAIGATQEKAKRRSEAATGGLHMRLLTVERYLRQTHAQAHAAAPAAAPVARRTAPAEAAAPAAAIAPKGQLTRGEMDLFLKVRQMNGKET